MPRAISVVIPAYNEAEIVGDVVGAVRQVLRDANITPEIIVVDDGSTDTTAVEAESAGVRVLRHTSNRGYGAALKTGILAAQYDLIAILDADGTYPVEQLSRLIAAADDADMVVGARIGANVHMPWLRRVPKWFLNKLANYVSRSKILDLNSGMRVFWRGAVLQYFNILPDQFSFTSTITVAMHCDRYAIRYMPIDYRERRGQSKIVPWDAGNFAMLTMRTAMLFKPLRVFLPIVAVFLSYSVVKGSFDYAANGFVSHTAILLLMGAIQFFLIGLLAEVVATRLNRTVGQFYSGVHAENSLSTSERSRSAAFELPTTEDLKQVRSEDGAGTPRENIRALR